ncbi:diptericin-D-like [Euwallacea similis]|uniref:diptericin-D-like n=1 Tax=Euwallacea similis TaxID=1736056 RepID=UPI00344C918B
MRSAVIFLFAGFALCRAALPLDQHDEEISPVLYRQRREQPQWYGGGGGDRNSQHGTIGLHNPDGSGGRVSYGHATGYGHDLSVDAMVPVWKHQNGLQESTLNLGGGLSHHFGGPGGNRFTDERVGINFLHRF